MSWVWGCFVLSFLTALLLMLPTLFLGSQHGWSRGRKDWCREISHPCNVSAYAFGTAGSCHLQFVCKISNFVVWCLSHWKGCVCFTADIGHLFSDDNCEVQSVSCAQGYCFPSQKTFSPVGIWYEPWLSWEIFRSILRIMLLCYKITLGRCLGNVRFGLLVFLPCDENKPINLRREYCIECRISVLSTSGLLFSQLHMNILQGF